jgi:hypothetical protein
MRACLEGARASFSVAGARRAAEPPTEPPTEPVTEAVPVMRPSAQDGEMERLLHDGERLTRELLREIHTALGLVNDRTAGRS